MHLHFHSASIACKFCPRIRFLSSNFNSNSFPCRSRVCLLRRETEQHSRSPLEELCSTAVLRPSWSVSLDGLVCATSFDVDPDPGESSYAQLSGAISCASCCISELYHSFLPLTSERSVMNSGQQPSHTFQAFSEVEDSGTQTQSAVGSGEERVGRSNRRRSLADAVRDCATSFTSLRVRKNSVDIYRRAYPTSLI